MEVALMRDKENRKGEKDTWVDFSQIKDTDFHLIDLGVWKKYAEIILDLGESNYPIQIL